MEQEKNIEILQMLLNTLNSIEVKGSENLDKMLGSINAIKQLIKNISNPSVEADKEEE